MISIEEIPVENINEFCPEHRGNGKDEYDMQLFIKR